MKNKLSGNRCVECGKVYYPKRKRCIDCGGDQFEDVKLSAEVTLVTYTELTAIPQGIEQLPLKLGIVEFEDGCRVLGQIRADSLDIGMKLRPTRMKLREVQGESLFGIVFKST